MEEEKELVNAEVESEDEELDVETEDDDTDEYIKAKTFPIDENWPEELKKQVEQLNQMSAIINADVTLDEDNDEDDSVDEDSDEDDSEEEVENEETPTVSTEETETFEDIF